jgi:TPR repeat protein
LRKYFSIIILILSSLPSYAQSIGKTVDVQPSGPFAQIDVKESNKTMQILMGKDQASKQSEVDEILKHADQYNPVVLYALADALFEQGKKDDAVFWFYAAYLRAKYDKNLCVDESAKGVVDSLNFFFDSGINLYLQQNIDGFEQMVEKILDWDQKTPYHYDHRWINLHGMQAMTYSLEAQQGKVPKEVAMSVPSSEWLIVYQKSRKEFADDLKHLEKILKQKKIAKENIDPDTSLAVSLYMSGIRGSSEDATKAFHLLSKAATKGDSVAEFYLGAAYHTGTGVAKDPTKEIHWTMKAAQSGNLDAQRTLGSLYFGDEKLKDGFLSYMWTGIAAENGHHGADQDRRLLETYMTPDEIKRARSLVQSWKPTDPMPPRTNIYFPTDEALSKPPIDHLQKAAEHGNADAQLKLSVEYASGSGLPHDQALALQWMRKSAEGGNKGAQHTLSMIYSSGDLVIGFSVPKDPVEAEKWRQKAAQK